MAERTIKIWYIKEADMLEVAWDDKLGYFTGTDDDRVLAEVDMEGNLQGVQIEGVTKLEDDVLKIKVPSPEKTK